MFVSLRVYVKKWVSDSALYYPREVEKEEKRAPSFRLTSCMCVADGDKPFVNGKTKRRV